MSDVDSEHGAWIGPGGIARLLAVANLAVTAGVLLSPWGSDGAVGVIGYSILRLVILAVVQAPLVLSAVAVAVLSAREDLPWGATLFAHLVIAAGTVYLYFA